MAIVVDNLNNYFDMLASGISISRDESMSNYLLRISSYSNFPRDVDIFTIKLSNAGFYYTGHADEVRCYSCGLTHKQWKSGDNPLNFHRNMSPSCSHLVNSYSENERICTHNCNIQNNLEFCSVSRSPDRSASSVTTSIHARPSSTNSPCAIFDNKNECSTTTRANTNSYSDLGKGRSRHGWPYNGYETTGHNAGPDTKEEMRSSKDVNLDKPRYPDYVSLPIRISSFKGAPSFLEEAAYKMAAAGFMYAGSQDHTKCFFCGGGLTTWQAGDDPWVEHARWFPKCAYLRQYNISIQAAQGKQDLSGDFSIHLPPLSNADKVQADHHNTLRDGVATDRNMGMSYEKEVSKDIPKITLSSSEIDQLIEENIQLKEERLCKICLHDDVSICFLPCGHMCCPDCAPAIKKCPMCRADVKRTLKVFQV